MRAKQHPLLKTHRSSLRQAQCRLLIAPLIITLCSLILGLLLAYWLPMAQSFTIGEADDTAIALGFLPPAPLLPFDGETKETGDTSFRWISGDSALRLFGLDAAPGSVTVRMVAPNRPTTPLTVSYDGRPLTELTPPDQWRRYTLLLPAPDEPLHTPQLSLRGGLSLPTASDSRTLRVAVSAVQVRSLAEPHPWPLLERTLILALGYGLLLALLWQFAREPRRWWPLLPPLLVGAAVRVGWVLAGLHVNEADALEYHRLAAELAAGEAPGLELWAPGWPLLLGLIYRVFGPLIAAGVWLNVVLSLATLLVGALLAGALFGRRAMVTSAWLLALLPSYIAVNVMLVYEVWLQLLLVLALLLALRRPWRWPTLLALACLSALATLVRPFWLLLPCLLWLVACMYSPPRTQRMSFNFSALSAPSAVKQLVMLQVGAMVLLLPLVVFQSMQAGQFVPVSANSGVNFWIGNSANAYGGYFLPPDEISDPRNDGQVRDEVIAYALANPGHVLGLLPHKLRFLFDREYFEGIVNTDLLSETQLDVLFDLADGSYFLILGLALTSVAVLLTRRQWGLLAPLLLFAYNIASYMPFFGDARFRWPVQFLLVIYAAALPVLLRVSHKGTD